MDMGQVRHRAEELGTLRGEVKKNKYNQPIPDIHLDPNFYVYERKGVEYVVPGLSRREVVQMVRYATGEMATEYGGIEE